MAVPAPPTGRDAASSTLLRAAMWVAIGALVAAALLCVVWVLVGGDDGILAKAFLTVLLLAGFGGVAILEARLAPRRPDWFVLTSMVVWVVVLLIGALLIWLPEDLGAFVLLGTATSRFFRFLLIVGVLGLGLLHVRLYLRAHARYVTPFTRVIAAVTVGLVGLLAVMLVVPLVLEEYVDFPALYWRFTVAIAILAAVGTALLPLLRALFGPRTPRPDPRAWPTYADGRTPLPVLPDGAPDWQAYYSGRPSLVGPPYAAPGYPFGVGQPAGPPPSAPSGWAGAPARPPVPSLPAAPQASAAPAGATWTSAAPVGAPPLPPPPTTPLSGGPLPASSHGWWGGRPATSEPQEPAMRWAEDTEDWPTEPVRRRRTET